MYSNITFTHVLHFLQSFKNILFNVPMKVIETDNFAESFLLAEHPTEAISVIHKQANK